MGEKHREKRRKRAMIILSGIAFIFIYSFVHELGHGLIGLYSGGDITEFEIGFNAHISIRGAHYNAITLPLMNAFGALLPYFVFGVLIWFYNSKSSNPIYHFLHFLAGIGIAGSMISWVVIPIVFVYGNPPAGDDVTKFLNNSDIHFVWVSMVAFLLILFHLFVSFKVKKVHLRFFELVKNRNRKVEA